MPRPIWVLFTSDEEIGSPTSRGLIEKLARRLCLCSGARAGPGRRRAQDLAEGRGPVPSRGRGQGRPRRRRAPARPKRDRRARPPDPQSPGRARTSPRARRSTSASSRAARPPTSCPPTHRPRSTCVSPRRRKKRGSNRRSTRSLPVTPDNRLTLSGSFNRPPMERTPAIAALFEQARQLARPADLGFELTEGSTGGGSDGNFTAALGIPTLDGLGPRGGGAHADDEHILIDSLPERAALLHLLAHGLVGRTMTDTKLSIESRRRDHDPPRRSRRRLSRLPGGPETRVGNQRGRLSDPGRHDGRCQSSRRPGPRRVPAARRGRRDVVRVPRADRGPICASTRSSPASCPSINRAGWATRSSSSSADRPSQKESSGSPGRSTRSRLATPISTWLGWVPAPRRYVENMYGERTDRLNAGVPTDRLIAEWELATAPLLRSPSIQSMRASSLDRAEQNSPDRAWFRSGWPPTPRSRATRLLARDPDRHHRPSQRRPRNWPSTGDRWSARPFSSPSSKSYRAVHFVRDDSTVRVEDFTCSSGYNRYLTTYPCQPLMKDALITGGLAEA